MAEMIINITLEQDGYLPVETSINYRPILGGSGTVQKIEEVTLDVLKKVIDEGNFSLSWVRDHIGTNINVVTEAITEKILPLVGDKNKKYVEVVSNLIMDGRFDLSTLEMFAKSKIFGPYSEQVEQLYAVIERSVENGHVDLDGIMTLIVDNVLRISSIRKLVDSGVIREETLRNLVKDGTFNGNALAELVTDGLLGIDFIQEIGKKGYIDLEGFQEAMKNIDFSSFETLKDPDTIEQIARGILPERFKDWSLVAGDIIRYPEKGIYEAGEKALDLAGTEAVAFLQGPGREKIKVLLDSVPGIGAFLKTSGLDDLAITGVSSLIMTGVSGLKNLMSKKIGIHLKKVPPSPHPVKMRFTGAPKVVYSLNESFTYDGIRAEVLMSDGSKKEVDYSSLSMTGFDSRQYTETKENERPILKASPGGSSSNTPEMVFTLANSSTSEDLKIHYPYVVAEKFLNGLKYAGSSTNKTQYIVGEYFDTTGLLLRATYTDNSESDVPEGAITISGYDNTKVGTQTIKAWYGGDYSVDLSVTVIAPKPEDIHLERVPDQTVFLVDEEFNAHGLVVTGDYYIDGKLVTLPIPSNLLTISNPIFSRKEDVHEIKITYYNQSLSYNVKVIDDSFIFLQVQTKPFKRQFRPGEKFSCKDLLVVGIKGNMTRMVIDPEDYYSLEIVKTKEVIQIPYESEVLQSEEYQSLYKRFQKINDTQTLATLREESIISSAKDYYFRPVDVGSELSVRITCKKNLQDDTSKEASVEVLSTSYDIEVLPERNDFLRYEVLQKPKKLVYTPYETLDLDGIEIYACYGTNNDPTGEHRQSFDHIVERIQISTESFNFSPKQFQSISFDGKTQKTVPIYGFMNHSLHRSNRLMGAPSEDNVSGYDTEEEVQEALVNQDHVCSFSVLVIDGNIESIQITALPKTDYFYGESFDSKGLEVVGIYTNGYRWVIPTDQLIFENFSTEKPRHQKIKVIYKTMLYPTTNSIENVPVPRQLVDYYTINVKKGILNSIAIKHLPYKTRYYPRDSLDIRGLSILALYSSGYTEKVSLNDSRLKILGYYSLRVKKVVPVTVDYHGYRAVFSVSIVQRNIHHITLEAPPQKVVYVAGERTPASWLGMRVLAHNTNGDKTPLDINDVTIVGFDSDCAYGLIECSVDYEGYDSAYSTTLRLLVLEGNVTKITMRQKPIKRQYGLFDSIDVTGMVVELECMGSSTPRVIPNELLTIHGFDSTYITSENSNEDGYYRVCTITLGGTNVDPIHFQYQVHNNNFKGLLIQEPVQHFLPEIYENDDGSYPLSLLPYDCVLVEQYETNDGVYNISKYLGEITTKQQQADKESTNITLHEDDFYCTCNVLKDKNGYKMGYRLVVTKKGLEKREGVLSYLFGILVVRENYSISSPTLPEKRTYLLGEKLNMNKCSLVLYGIDNSFSKEMTITESGITLEPYTQELIASFNSEDIGNYNYYKCLGVSVVEPDMSYSGLKKVKITSGLGHYWEFPIMVVSPDDVPISLDLVQEPDKLDYNIGDQEIDLTGIEIYQVYPDGTRTALSEDGLRVESFNTSVIGTSKVIVSYAGQLYTTYEIDVHAVPNVLIMIQEPYVKEYYPGQEVDLDGLVLQAEYMDQQGHTYTEDVDINDCIVHDFHTKWSDIKKNNIESLIEGETLHLLYSVEYRGCIIFIPYSIVLMKPMSVKIYPLTGEYYNGLPVLKQTQTHVDQMNGLIYLKDISVDFTYPNGSIIHSNLQDVMIDLDDQGNFLYTMNSSNTSMYDSQMKQLRTPSSTIGGRNNRDHAIEVYRKINICGTEVYHHYQVIRNAPYGIAYGGLYGSNGEEVMMVPNNEVQGPLDIMFYLLSSNEESTSSESISYRQYPERFRNVPNEVSIGDQSIDNNILYIHNGYVLPLQQNDSFIDQI